MSPAPDRLESAPHVAARPGSVRVEIFVAEHCPTCTFAYEVAAMIRHEFPAGDLHLIQMDDPNIVIPESVFATPTYLLNGRRWSLGNPSPEEVRQALSNALRA